MQTKCFLSLDGIHISLDPPLPPSSTAESDGEKEDDCGEAGGHSKEQVLDKLRPGIQCLNVDVNLLSLCADGVLDELDVGVVDIDEDDGGDLEEEDDEDADAVEGEQALVLLLGSTKSKECKVEVLVAGSLLHCLLQPVHPLLHIVPLLSVSDLIRHLPEAFIVHNPPNSSS